MPVFQGNYKSLLGGVSQQVYTDRQPSQVETQVNMLSDTVRGIRKRPGTRLSIDVNTGGTDQWSIGNTGHLRRYTTNLGWGITSFVVNTKTGVITSIVETATVQVMTAQPYLITSTPADITFAAVGSTLYIANSSVKPVLITNETRTNPELGGFFFVLSGAYGKVFNVTVRNDGGSYTATYTTPSASSSETASTQATPEYIVTQLAAQLAGQAGNTMGIDTVTYDGAYLYVTTTAGHGSLLVTTTTGDTYAKASNNHIVDSTDDLPARLPVAGEGFIVTVGDASFAQYFQWDSANSKWTECGAYGSPTGIDSATMPISIVSASATNQHEFETLTWTGRDAGDADNNATPAFADASGVGITGLSSFQGRLVVFSGPYISMSSSAKAYRNSFYRTTVTQVLDSDRIEFTATSFSGANFRHGVPFNSDLILVSAEHQGVIPGRNQVLTPNNATAVLTSAYQMDADVAPQVAGRSLYYTYPRSNSSYSVKEMMPSGYTDLQYVSQDVTDHLPTYLEGAASFITSATTNNIVVFGSTADKDTLYVNEYLWSADQKVLSSWHKWEFAGTIHAAWFVRETLCILIERDSHMLLCTLSLRDSPDPTDAARYLPALDYTVPLVVADTNSHAPSITFPASGAGAQLWDAIVAHYTASGDLSDVTATTYTGQYIGAEVGISSIDMANRKLMLQPTYGTERLTVGIRYTSKFAPTPPRVLDNNGDYMDVDKLIVQGYNLTLSYTTPFNVTSYDRGGYVYNDDTLYAIDYTDSELDLLAATLAKRYHLRVRVGLDAESSYTVFTSRTHGDFNVQGLGYIIKYNIHIRRV